MKLNNYELNGIQPMNEPTSLIDSRITIKNHKYTCYKQVTDFHYRTFTNDLAKVIFHGNVNILDFGLRPNYLVSVSCHTEKYVFESSNENEAFQVFLKILELRSISKLDLEKMGFKND
jgi:hypothetical protein